MPVMCECERPHGLGTYCWTCDAPVAPLARLRARPKVKRREKDVQLEVRRTFQLRGWTVADMSQSRPTQQMPGFSDLVCFHPAGGGVVFCEVKGTGGKQSEAQRVFERVVLEAGARYLLARGAEDVLAFLGEP